MWSASTIAALQIGRGPVRNNKSEDDIINRNIVSPQLHKARDVNNLLTTIGGPIKIRNKQELS